MDIKIIEVGPRDGLQNEEKILSTIDKYSFIKLLAEAGLTTIEAASFVRPDRIPQMEDAEELCGKLLTDPGLKDINFPCLVPNLKGLEVATKAGVKEISVFTATSESFNQKNINSSIDESLANIKKIIENAGSMKVRGYISTVFGCPYEGKTSVKVLLKVMEYLFEKGVFEISLGDTIGIGNPLQTKDILKEIKNSFDLNKVAMHFHDTRGMALANSLASLEMGIGVFDSSAGGLGGCPYAKGATGNVATEDLVYMFEAMGLSTGVDLAKLVTASQFIENKVGHNLSSKVYQVISGGGK
ncbi:MAG: hydroxymethylglutaryl-CoA lyase [Deltaproteobacteria bacterium]|nr:MAG: hydroxymethylglutaryl-CoA lyase [Deltaproteobacteria bacterium]